MALVEFGEIRKEICIQWLDDVAVGSYILAHAGTAISKIDEEDAKDTLDLLREMDQAMDPENS